MPSFEMLTFELPKVLPTGAGLVAVAVLGTAFLLRRRGLSWGRLAAVLLCRVLALAAVVVLLARPVALAEAVEERRRSIALLLDTSRSMALLEGGTSRWEQVLDAVEERLLPAFEDAALGVEVFLFDTDVAPVSGVRWQDAAADGERTDLGGAIVQAVRSSSPAPLAVVALTDGVANVAERNRAAHLALVDTATPFVGLGVGSDVGADSLGIVRLVAPRRVAPRQEFRVEVELQVTANGAVSAFDLLFLRDGELLEVRRVPPDEGSRRFTESFTARRDTPGTSSYTVEVQAPFTDDLIALRTRATLPVRVVDENTVRVLFVQGALTWNYKFVGRALRGDPSLRLTGLSRTSETSVFRQGIESESELVGGFPDTLEELAAYQAVVLSELRPADLTTVQQETLARFVGELGGGLLLLGGASTFDASWHAGRLEELLPVRFDPAPGLVAADRPFHLELTDAARAHPVFTLDDGGGEVGERSGWETLPTFTHYGRVLEAKAGATVWALHDHDRGPRGRRILIASQPYGAGFSTIVALKNLWRWRLSRGSRAEDFDRFWRQLLRYLAQSGGEGFTVELLDQDLTPGAEITALVEKRPRPGADGASDGPYRLRVEDPEGGELVEIESDLAPGRPSRLTFRPEREGIHRLTVRRGAGEGVEITSRPIEIRRVDGEMERTARDLESLRQWASVSGGTAMAFEDLDVDALIEDIHARRAALVSKQESVPLGLDLRVLLFILAGLAGEQALRKRWGLV